MGNSERTKNALGRKSSIFIIGSIPGRISQTCCATRSRCISSTTILTTRLKSEASPPPFLVGQCASLTVSSKRISFHEKIAKQYLTRHALSCDVRLEFVINPRPPKHLASIFIFKCWPARPGDRVKALCPCGGPLLSKKKRIMLDLFNAAGTFAQSSFGNCAREAKMDTPQFINEVLSDVRCIKPGWYAMDEVGNLSSGPFSSHAECFGRIIQPVVGPLQTLNKQKD